MEQIERIRYMEELLDETEKVIRKLSVAIEDYEKIKDKINELESYYESPLWKIDYEDDEAGKLPKDLKRGVLSQDAVYNLLSELKNIQDKMWSN
jgi:hypothetical protein